MDGIELEIVWSNLISIVSEQAKALQRIAFSPVVREAGDLANALFDRQGRMVAQAVTGTPGHINSLAAAGQAFRRGLPGRRRSQPGDVLITNDPWLSAGHFFDITVMLPAYPQGHAGRLLRFDHPSHRHRRIRRRRRRARRARGGPVDSHAQALPRRGSRARCCTRSSVATCARRTTCSAISRRRCRAAGSPASGCRHCSTGMAMTTSIASPTR